MKKYTDFTKKEIELFEKLSQLDLADLRNISNKKLIDLLKYNFKFPADYDYIVENDEKFNDNAQDAVLYYFKYKVQYVVGCIIYLLSNIGHDLDVSSGFCLLQFRLYPNAYPVRHDCLANYLHQPHKDNPFELKGGNEFNKFTKVQCKLIFVSLEMLFQSDTFGITYVDRYALAYFWFYLSNDKSIDKIDIGETVWEEEEEEVAEFLNFYNLPKL